MAQTNRSPEPVLDTMSSRTGPLRIGQTVYSATPNLVRPHIVGGFLTESNDPERPIRMVTGGGDVAPGAMFFRDALMRVDEYDEDDSSSLCVSNRSGGSSHDDDESYLGRVVFSLNGTHVIELQGIARRQLINILFSETAEECMPSVFTGTVIPLVNTEALLHATTGFPSVVRILQARRLLTAGGTTMEPCFAISQAPTAFGGLVTSKQGGGPRQLQVYGNVHSIDNSSGPMVAMISMLHPVLRTLEQQENLQQGCLQFLVPVLPRESDDKGELLPSPTSSTTVPIGGSVDHPSRSHLDSSISIEGEGVSGPESDASLASLGAAAAAAAAAQSPEGASSKRSDTPCEDNRDSAYSTKSQQSGNGQK